MRSLSRPTVLCMSNSRPENLFAIYPSLHRVFLAEKIVEGLGQVKGGGLAVNLPATLQDAGAHRPGDLVAVGVVTAGRQAAGA